MTRSCQLGGTLAVGPAARRLGPHLLNYKPYNTHLDKSGVFFASSFYETLRYAKKVSEPPPRYVMTGGARLAFSDTHKHHTYRKI